MPALAAGEWRLGVGEPAGLVSELPGAAVEEYEQRPLALTCGLEVELLQRVFAIGDRGVGLLPARPAAHFASTGRIAQREGEEGCQAGHTRCVGAGGAAA